MPELDALRGILELGWPAIVLIANYILWRALIQAKQEHIEDLRAIAGLRHQLHSTQTLVQGFKAGNGPGTSPTIAVSQPQSAA